jgi:hypothetical protein
VRSLVDLIEASLHYAMARTGVGVLKQVLGRTAARAISKDVQAAAMLSDVSSISHERRESMACFLRQAVPGI